LGENDNIDEDEKHPILEGLIAILNKGYCDIKLAFQNSALQQLNCR